VVTLEDLKMCANACGKSGNKRCARCQTTFYCSKECQTSHWKEHKQTCKAPENVITVDTSKIPADSKYGCTIPTGKLTLGLANDEDTMDMKKFAKDMKKSIRNLEESAAPKKPGKVFIVKVQVPMGGSKLPCMVYNKNKSFQTLITPDNCTQYNKIVELIKTKGVMGLKGYFNALVDDNGNFKILCDELLPQQPW
jgi:hypothetical protein